MTFKNRFDRSNRLISLLVSIFLMSLAVIPFISPTPGPFILLIPLMNAAILFFTWALHPRAYRLENGSLHIERLIKSIKIPLSSISEISAAEPAVIAKSWRLMGSGGLFGLYGRFQNKLLGRYLMYVTDRHSMVLLRSAGETWLISPRDRDGFLLAAEQMKKESK